MEEGMILYYLEEIKEREDHHLFKHKGTIELIEILKTRIINSEISEEVAIRKAMKKFKVQFKVSAIVDAVDKMEVEQGIKEWMNRYANITKEPVEGVFFTVEKVEEVTG